LDFCGYRTVKKVHIKKRATVGDEATGYSSISEENRQASTACSAARTSDVQQVKREQKTKQNGICSSKCLPDIADDTRLDIRAFNCHQSQQLFSFQAN